MKRLLPILGTIYAVLILTGCNPAAAPTTPPEGSAVEPATPTAALVEETIPDTEDESEEASPEAMVDTDTDYVVDMKSFSFNPNKLTMKAGTTLKIKLNNKEGVHDLVIDELKVKSKQLKVGESQVVEITVPASAAGKSYEFYCSVGKHRQMGMVGTLTVTK